jgi:hypothetical protein
VLAPGIRFAAGLGFHEHLRMVRAMLPDQISGEEMWLVERTRLLKTLFCQKKGAGSPQTNKASA